jgi:hypothetical protein
MQIYPLFALWVGFKRPLTIYLGFLLEKAGNPPSSAI